MTTQAPDERTSVQYHARIRDLPSAERPRERLRDYGANALSTSELLAIILRVGSAKESALALASRLLAQRGGLVGLARTGFGELCAERGLGEAKAAQILAALELGKRLASTTPDERATVRSPQDVAGLLMAEMSLLEQEHLRVVLLDTRNRVLAVQEMYKGSVNSSQVRVGELFRDAVRQNAPALILVHNHPSGDPTPSPDDVSMASEAVKAGKLLDVDVLDHVIIGGGRFVSLKERGLGFA